MAREKPSLVKKYIDPLTDFGFKRLFGNEPNKDLLIDLLNSIFGGRKHIVDLVYNKNEHPGDTKEEGAAIFDLTCTGQNGERMIIEVQRGKQVNFKQRALYYTSHLAAGLAPKGKRAEWGYVLPEIYFIALLEDFSIDEESNGHYMQNICLTNRDTGKLFYDGLQYIFLELVNFAKAEKELETSLDKWLYLFKNMSRLEKIPVFGRKTIFEKVFSIAEYSNMTKQEKTMYNSALKRKWDNAAVLDYAVKTALEEGIKQERVRAEAEIREIISNAEAEKRQIVLALKKIGMQAQDIAKAVGLSLKEVEQI